MTGSSEVSAIVTLEIWDATLKIIVSDPSVAASLTKVTPIVASPSASTVAVPVRPPLTSADDTPLIVQSNSVSLAALVESV